MRPRPGTARAYPFVLGTVVGLLVAALAVPVLRGEQALVTSSSDPQGSSALNATGQPDSGSGAVGPDGSLLVPSDTPAGQADSGSAGSSGSSTQAGTSTASQPGQGAGRTTGTSATSGNNGGATDTGVTGSEVVVGLLNYDPATAAAVGGGSTFDAGADAKEWQNWATVINQTVGEAHGRKLVIKIASYDPFDTASQRRACIALTETAKAFIVIDPSGAYSGESKLCVTQEHKTLLWSQGGVGSDFYRRSAGLLFTMGMSTDRQLRQQARLFHGDGTLKGKTIGVVYSQEPTEVAAAELGLLPELKRLGVTVKRRTVLSSDPSNGSSQIPPALTQMRLDGVDFIFLVINAIYIGQWAREGDAQQYYPTHAVTDVSGGSDDFALAAAPRTFRAIGSSTVTTKINGSTGVKPMSSPWLKTCASRYQKVTGKQIPPPEDFNNYFALRKCFWTGFLQDVLERNGPSLTRASFSRTQRATTNMTYWWQEPAQLGWSSDKFDLPDSLRRIKVKSDCTTGYSGAPCWVPAGEFVRVGR